ncbi:type II toxin-antitoxin system Phd/YefM family antitoxin [Candidatus Roizmanbacteria bacterium]|nr:type II toxin-antitoxin system Phd/YefM family antitoxin [Candidatus Roizmanbacteria bacterium]
MNTTNQLPISVARANLPELVDKVSKYLDRVIITVKGRPKATLVSTEELGSLEETAKIMAIPNIKKDIVKSRKQIKKGQYISLADLK